VAIDKRRPWCHAGAGVHSGTVVNALLHRFGALSGVAGALRPGIVHRLDRYNQRRSGCGKNDDALGGWRSNSRAGRWEKVYQALVHAR